MNQGQVRNANYHFTSKDGPKQQKEEFKEKIERQNFEVNNRHTN